MHPLKQNHSQDHDESNKENIGSRKRRLENPETSAPKRQNSNRSRLFDEQKKLTEKLLNAKTFANVIDVIDSYPQFDVKRYCRLHKGLQQKWHALLQGSADTFNAFFDPASITSEVTFKPILLMNNFDLLHAHYWHLEFYAVFAKHYQGDIKKFYEDIGSDNYIEVNQALLKAKDHHSIHSMFFLLQMYISDIYEREIDIDEDFQKTPAVVLAKEIATLYGTPGYVYLANVYNCLATRFVSEESDENFAEHLNLRISLLSQAYYALLKARQLEDFSSAATRNVTYGADVCDLNSQGFTSIQEAINFFEANMSKKSIEIVQKCYNKEIGEVRELADVFASVCSKI